MKGQEGGKFFRVRYCQPHEYAQPLEKGTCCTEDYYGATTLHRSTDTTGYR